MHFLLKKVEILSIMLYFAMSRLQNAVFCSIFALSAIDILPYIAPIQGYKEMS